MGVIMFTANPLTPLKKLKLEINVLIFGQILTIFGLISVTRDPLQGHTLVPSDPILQFCAAQGGVSALGHTP